MKNEIIIGLIILALAGTIWGSFKDKENRMMKESVASTSTTASGVEAKVLRYTCTKTMLSSMLAEAHDFESMMHEQWLSKPTEAPPWVLQELEDIKEVKSFLNERLNR